MSGAASASIRTRRRRNCSTDPASLIERRRASQGGRHRRDRARLLLRAQSARGSRSPISAPISRRRAQTGLPVIVHTRDADDDTIDDPARRDGEGRLHRPDPLLHRHAAPGRRGAGAGASIFRCPASRPSRIPASCATCSRTCRWTGCWWRPTRRYLAPVPHRGKSNEPAFVVHTAAMLAELKGVSAGRTRRRDDGEFLPPVHQSRAARSERTGLKSRFWAAARPAACRGWADRTARVTGAPAIPPIPKNRRRRCSLLVRRKSRRGRDRRAGRHLARHARAASGRARRPARWRADHP